MPENAWPECVQRDRELIKVKLRSEEGFVLAAVLTFTLILTIIGMSFLNMGGQERIQVRHEANYKKAFYAADGGIEYGVLKLNELLGQYTELSDNDEDGDIADDYDISPPTMEGFTFDVFTIAKVGDQDTKTIESGQFKGMEAIVQEYKITSQATYTGSGSASARIVQNIESQRFNTFQFGIFYDQDLELEPGAEMTMTGRMHSNHDIYLTSSTLKVDSYVTSAGDIYRTDKPGDTGNEGGDTHIKDKDGHYKSLSFDSTDPDWADKAQETWGGTVLSKDHGVQALTIPMSTEEEPIETIKRGDTIDPDSSSESETLKEARLYWQADLRIIDGQAYDKAGNEVDLTYTVDGDTINPVDSSKSFYDHREGRTIKVTEIDVDKLADSGEFPANGVLYVSTHTEGQKDGVRLVNGSELPSGGLTVGTDNPLYIQGDYNTIGKKPAAVLCDATNILSNSWDDNNSSSTNLNDRKATATGVNVCVMTGHLPTTDAGYGGGVENLPRFLEKWTGKIFTWRGSINSLWYSQEATGQWIYGSPYYTAPNRCWEFDPDLLDSNNLPPGIFHIRTLQKTNWDQVEAE